MRAPRVVSRKALGAFSGRGLLDPQSAPTGRRDVAVDHLAAVGGHEEVAAVALLSVLRSGLIMDRGLRDLGLRLPARKRQQGGGAGRGKKDSAAADTGCVASLAHERLLGRRDYVVKRARRPQRTAP